MGVCYECHFSQTCIQMIGLVSDWVGCCNPCLPQWMEFDFKWVPVVQWKLHKMLYIYFGYLKTKWRPWVEILLKLKLIRLI